MMMKKKRKMEEQLPRGRQRNRTMKEDEVQENVCTRVREGPEKFLDQINAFRGAGDRDHALFSSLPTRRPSLRLSEAEKPGERKSTHTTRSPCCAC